MNIKQKSQENLDKRTLYKLTKGESMSVQEAAGKVLSVKDFVVYEDTNARGEEVNILAILDQDGSVYSTISDTFKRRFLEIVDIFGEDLPGVLVTTGTTKNGRTYMSCTIE